MREYPAIASIIGESVPFLRLSNYSTANLPPPPSIDSQSRTGVRNHQHLLVVSSSRRGEVTKKKKREEDNKGEAGGERRKKKIIIIIRVEL